MRTSSVLVILLIVFTFPIWIGILGGIFGVMFGLIGGAIGIVAGVFGAVIGAIGGVIGGIFGLAFDSDWPRFHFNPFWFAVIFICVVLLVRSRRQAR